MDYKAEINSWSWRFRRAGATQDDIAERAGISTATLNKIIKGKTTNPKIETLTRVSKSLADLEKEAGIKEAE